MNDNKMDRCDFCSKEGAVERDYITECTMCPSKNGLYGFILGWFLKCENCNDNDIINKNYKLCERCHKLVLKSDTYHEIMVIISEEDKNDKDN